MVGLARGSQAEYQGQRSATLRGTDCVGARLDYLSREWVFIKASTCLAFLCLESRMLSRDVI